MVYKNKFINNLKDFSFNAGSHIIKPKKSIKILGQIIRDDLKLDSQVGTMCANLHNKLFELKKLSKYTDFKTRLKFVNSHILGKINYLTPLYLNANKNQIDKMHKVLMTSARTVIGNYCFRKSKSYILNKCGWLDIANIIKLIHNIIKFKTPTAIFEMFHINQRSNVDIVTLYRPKT